MSACKAVFQLTLLVYVAHLCIVSCKAECIQGQLDVLFLFDSSSTVGASDFRRGLQFASTLAENFHIAPDGVQFGAASFSDNPSNLFNLNMYSEFQGIQKAILGGQFLSGNTRTYLALENAQTLFDQSRGGRAGAPKVVVVFTNGRSDDASRTQQQALRLKNSGVFVIVVGLFNSNNQELQAIASNSSVVFNIDNFNVVLKFLQDYSNNACSQPAECIQGQLDVLFLFDSSSTVGASDFRRGLQFASTLAENFHIGPDGVQFGAASFSDNPSNLFNLNMYSEFQGIQKAILGGQLLSGNTRTYLALENAQTLFDQSRGGRAGAPKVVVLFTNGRSDDASRTQQQALRLKNSGVFVIVVGLSNSNNQELQAIASNSSVVFNIDNFNGVLKFLQDYNINACSQPGEIITAKCIQGQLDVLFLFDSSSAVGASDFRRGLQFASTLAENFHIGPDGVQFGATSFSDSPSNLFNLNTYSEFQGIQKAILGGQFLSGNTRTYLALENAQTLFDQSRGGRAGAPKVVVLFTNGRSDDASRTQQQALRLKNSGVFVIVVGLSNSNNQELQAIASNSSVVFNIENFNGVLKFLQDYSNNACSLPVTCTQGQLDILFIVDASSKVPVQEFTHELGVSANLAENFQIGPDAVQFSTVTFADGPHNLFDFNTYTNFSSLEAAILQAQYLSGSTNTFLALERSRDLFFGSHGARSGAAKVALLFSNGGSTDPPRTQQEAAVLKSDGVYVITVAVSNVIDSELQAVSSSRDAVFQINDFDSILHALQGYLNTACNQAPCMKGALDVLYVFDSSSTVTTEEFNSGLRFAANIAENFRIGADGFQFGAISFAANSQRIFDFTALTNYTDLEKTILNIAYQAGNTNTPLALQDSRNFFGDSQGARAGAPKVALVFTNGRSSDYAATAAQAANLKQSGVYVIAIGYSGANAQELHSIASDQNSVFSINDLSNVLKALLDYSNTACGKDE